MRSADWRVIGSIGIILGVLLIVGGFIAYFYEEQRWIFVVAPYRDMAVPLFISGIVLLVVGYVSNTRAEEEKQLQIERARAIQPTAIFCLQCGFALPQNAKFCPHCGKALN